MSRRHRARQLARGHDVVRAELLRHLELAGIDVRRDDRGAVTPRQLRGDLAHQPEPQHHDAIAERDLRQTDAVQRDRADRHEAAVVVRHRVGHPRGEVPRHVVDFGVVGVAQTGAGHTIADMEVRRRGADLEHFTRARVAERNRRAHQVLDDLVRAPIPLLLRLVEHLPEQIGTVLRLADRALVGERDDRALGAEADQRTAHADEQAVRAQDGRRKLLYLQLTGLQILRHCLHCSSLTPSG